MAMTGNARVSHFAEPCSEARAVTPGDDTDLAITYGSGTAARSEYPRALYVGVAGDVNLLLEEDSAPVVFKAVPIGILWVRYKKVYSTSTAATNMVALY